MRKSYVFGAVLLTSVPFFSCNSNSKQEVLSDITFDTLTIDTVCSLFAEMDKPACHLRIMMEYPVASVRPDLLPTVESFVVGSYFKDSYIGMTAVDAAQKYADTYLENYKQEGTEAKENYGADLTSSTTWMNYEELSEGKVLYDANEMLSYGVTFYSYLGGAHGNTSVSNHVLDLRTACQLSLCDLFADNAMSDVSQMLREALAKQYNCATVAALADSVPLNEPEEIDVTENFYVDDRGITWQFSPYEIAPYSVGIISVTLTWDQVLPFLLDECPLIRLAENKSTGVIS